MEIDYKDLSFPINAKSRQEIAEEYCISTKTLNRWLKRAKLNIPNGLITPLNLLKIYGVFGLPKKHKTD